MTSNFMLWDGNNPHFVELDDSHAMFLDWLFREGLLTPDIDIIRLSKNIERASFVYEKNKK